MSVIDLEYGLRKDVRNNPVVREVDRAQKREFMRTAGVVALAVVMLLFSAWQHFQVLRHGYQIETLQKQRAEEEAIGRQLRLEVETLRSPARIEREATTTLHMVPASPDDAVVIERVAPAVAGPAIVARAGQEPR